MLTSNNTACLPPEVAHRMEAELGRVLQTLDKVVRKHQDVRLSPDP